MRGVFISGLIIAVLSYVGLWIIGVEFRLALAVIAGILEIVPVFGSIIAGAQTEEMSEEELLTLGEEVYSTNCASCHLINGEGTNAYPAPNNSSLLTTGDPTQAIQVVLYGRGQMPAFEDTLATQQIAAVISYERNAWNNNASIGI